MSTQNMEARGAGVNQVVSGVACDRLKVNLIVNAQLRAGLLPCGFSECHLGRTSLPPQESSLGVPQWASFL